MKLFEILVQQLKKEINFVSDNGELKKWVVLNKAQNFDEELIGLLLDNANLKYKFFVTVKGALVFKQNLFVQFLEQKNYLNDSYTQYKNKVGLTIGGKYLKQRNEVALVWPFKDCILEGGQSREEDKREEIFFNEILAQDEITQLLEPKVLTNAKRIDKDGEKPLFPSSGEMPEGRGGFNRNENGTITDNLIIKGNNLLALHTLKKEFAGKVKLIYIDPPYNTGNDGFKYNDSFNHSTWLTFMKNRLEVARDLLREDGVIFVQSDDSEQAYIKVLMDEIFGENNYINTIIVKAKAVAGASGGGEDKRLKKNYEFVSFYGKKYEIANFKQPNPVLTKISDYIKEHKENNIGFYYTRVIKNYGNKERLGTIKAGDGSDIEIYRHKNYEFSSISKIAKEVNISIDDVYRKYFDDIFMVTNAQTSILTKVNDFVKGKNEFISYEYTPKTGKDKGKITTKMIWNKTLVVWFKDTAVKNDGGVYKSEGLGSLWTDISWGRLDLEGSVSLKSGKKPENLLKTIISMATESDDIVLDYHLGSGTTCAVAHKMNRQYIGIEQMDYIETIAVERLKKVIEGEQGGISKAVNWQGGGSFVYLELKKYNQTFIEQIEEAKDTKDILQIWKQMKAKSFLNYNVDIKKQDEHLEELKAYSIAEQKQHLCELLDKNQLYVNLSSLGDADFACTEEEKQVTQNFYQ